MSVYSRRKKEAKAKARKIAHPKTLRAVIKLQSDSGVFWV